MLTRKVLVVDDDKDLADLLVYVLQREGYTPLVAWDGHEALAGFKREQPDIVILDLNLPGIDGFEVGRRIRQESTAPIIVLSARDDEDDIVRGLRIGADDYVTKPFSAKQLVARIEAVLRRTHEARAEAPTRQMSFGNLQLDLEQQCARINGKLVKLTTLEFRLLRLLLLNQGRVVSYARMIEYAWGYHDESSSNLLKCHISHLRRKLGLRLTGPTALWSAAGLGYCLSARSK